MISTLSKSKFITNTAGKGIKVLKGKKNLKMVKDGYAYLAIESLCVIFKKEGYGRGYG